ncbi:hypothetical protein DPMN_121037 [Dreissena polymorpha]|uniref:Uncharacterized protein n=1 Tax=Dreissena polymorpha TaxID=45954 RepID=A0A9D4JSR0_DREPO|nr:hypothetical protein DPMN_121037 [Dreissena polymorpha]
MVTADVCVRKRSCFRLVDAGHEPLRRQYEIDLVLHLPVWKIAVIDGLCGYSMLARVSWWLLAKSRSLKPLSLVSPKPNLPTAPDQSCYASGPTLTF